MLANIVSRLLIGVVALTGLCHAAPPADIHARAVSSAGGQIVVDVGGVYMRATRLSDGSILGGYSAQDGQNRVLRVVKSTDGGASWTRIGTAASTPAAMHDMDNAFPLQLPNGRVLFAFRNHDLTASGSYTYFRITLCYSDDGGHNWSFLTQIDERPMNGVNGLWEPFLRVSRDGTLQAFYSSENSANDQDNIMKTSKDNGNTWSGPRPVSGEGITSRDGMTGVSNIDNNGNVICVFENTESGPFSIDYVLSQDDGFTWNSRTRLYTAANGKNAGAPHVINVGGRLVASFMTNEDSNTPALDGGQMKVIVSTDGGRSWGGSTVTGNTGSHWAGMYPLDSNQFLALYSFDGAGLVSQRYHL
ncbi:hypothetical protein TOPH_07320 [Tolypocladium ophioglossoides CBS 100239]|uniref:Sialidase domain-containing protein n=1 Tax=Tolypocladium ophioglossoides (strain CBS 100239) TaxID=1163406 RepID=A0A0L0N267_TOLOC|nr:hypothetical protein TOPH_07320 [Tolypocladium ophioglossoides CBS 100239]